MLVLNSQQTLHVSLKSKPFIYSKNVAFYIYTFIIYSLPNFDLLFIFSYDFSLK